MDDLCEECGEEECICERDCSVCLGTGIGQHGPPDTSICTACRGSGLARKTDDFYPDDEDDWSNFDE